MADFIMFDPSRANDLAQFQGGLIGTMAGRATYVGIGNAMTETLNQNGLYAFQNAETGDLALQRLHNDSIYTNDWYSQSMKQPFTFKNDKSVFSLSQLSDNMTASQIAALDN